MVGERLEKSKTLTKVGNRVGKIFSNKKKDLEFTPKSLILLMVTPRGIEPRLPA